MRLKAVMLGSENADTLGEFYTKILGEPGWRQDDWYGFDTGDTNLMVGPHSEVKGSSQEPARVMMYFEVNDIQSEFARIKGLGGKVIAEPYQPSKEDSPDMWLATFADPDGNYFQIATPWKE